MKIIYKILIFSFLFSSTTLFSSCSNRYGCPANEEAHVEYNTNKRFKKKKTKSGLFSSKQLKRSSKIRG